MKKIENFELQFIPMKQDELNACNGGSTSTYYFTCLKLTDIQLLRLFSGSLTIATPIYN
jgi:hypothetical protein